MSANIKLRIENEKDILKCTSISAICWSFRMEQLMYCVLPNNMWNGKLWKNEMKRQKQNKQFCGRWHVRCTVYSVQHTMCIWILNTAVFHSIQLWFMVWEHGLFKYEPYCVSTDSLTSRIQVGSNNHIDYYDFALAFSPNQCIIYITS